MLENSLKSRNKFVNKVVDKLNSLKDDLNLLYKVDNKISKNILKNRNNQLGGAREVDMREFDLALKILFNNQNNINAELDAAVTNAEKNNNETNEKINNIRVKLSDATDKINALISQVVGQKNKQLTLNKSLDLNVMNWNDENIKKVLSLLEMDWTVLDVNDKKLFGTEKFFNDLKKKYSPPPSGVSVNEDQTNIEMNAPVDNTVNSSSVPISEGSKKVLDVPFRPVDPTRQPESIRTGTDRSTMQSKILNS